MGQAAEGLAAQPVPLPYVQNESVGCHHLK